MRNVVRRYVPSDEARERGPKLAALLAAGLERLLRKEAPEGLAIRAEVLAYGHNPPEQADEEQ